MSTYSIKYRNLISTWLSVVFCSLLLLFLGFIEFFQDSKFENSPLDITKSPVSKNLLKNLNSVKIKNRIGEFHAVKENNNWFLKSPRSMPSKQKTIKSIKAALAGIKILTIHKNEPINYQSFSLDNPSLSLSLESETETSNIRIGLINPIDNTSFIFIEGKDRIYQTAILAGNLQALELTDFIDSSIFTSKIKNIKKIKIYRGKNITPFNSVIRQNNQWKFNKYRTIDQARTDQRIWTFLKTPPHLIIDKNDKDLNTFLDNYLKNPMYKIEIQTTKNETIKYTITNLIRSISSLKIENREFFIIKASNRKYPFLVNKQYLNNFHIKYSEIKP